MFVFYPGLPHIYTQTLAECIVELPHAKVLVNYSTKHLCVYVLSLSVFQCKSGGELIAGFLYVSWRSSITRYLHSQYFLGLNYYLINCVRHRVDNP